MAIQNPYILGNRNPGQTRMQDLIDVDLSSLADLSTLRWSASASKWESVAAGIVSVDEIQFNTSYTPAAEPEGMVWWNADDNTINISSGIGPVLQVGQEIQIKVYNNSGGDIDDGEAVYPTGAFNDFPTIGKAKTDTHTTISLDYGMATMDIPAGTYGIVTWFGKVRGIDTSAFDVGDPLYISATTAGELTKVKPEFPNYAIQIGIVFKKDATDGWIFVTGRSGIEETFYNFWNGTFREPIKFLVSEAGGVVTGALEPKNGHDDMTMIFSDGFTLLDTNPPLEITLTAGTDTVPQLNYIYIPKTTKVLTLSTTTWPATEHIKVAQVFLKTGATTGLDGPLMNQFWSDHIQDTVDDMGYLNDMSTRFRLSPPIWLTGCEGTATIVGASTPDDVFISSTAGTVFQTHDEVVDALDMATGDKIHVVNHNTTPYVAITNLNTQVLDAAGVSLDGKSYSVVVWGVQNVPGQAPQLMVNLPLGSYDKNQPTQAASDIYGYAVYDIPDAFKGVGFLIARFTFILATGSLVWTLHETQDLRGRIPNATAGTGSGASGVTTYLGLTDTDSSYTGNSLELLQVNVGETALEATSQPTIGDFTNSTHDHSNAAGGGIYDTHEADFFNGTFRESFNSYITESVGTIYADLEKSGTGDLTMRFSDGETILDCTPIIRIALTAGTVASPQENFVYILQSSKVLATSTVGWPSLEHIKVTYCLVQTAAVVALDGALVNQNWNDHLSDITNNMGHLTHMAERSRRLGAIWHSGVDGTGGDDYTTSAAGSVTIQCGSGVLYQMHTHSYTAKDTSAADDAHIVNAHATDGGSYYETQNLYDITVDTTNTTLTNKYFNIVLWGVANKGGTYSPLMVNIPTGSYTGLAAAQADAAGYTIYSMPTFFNKESSTGFLIARLTFRSTGGTWVYQSTVDLRGTTPTTATGGASGGIVSFPDNQFEVYDVADDTATMVFDASGIATGTTRTITIPDSNETIGTDATSIHDNVSGEITLIAEKITPIGADLLIIEDSASANVKKKVQITNLPGAPDADAIHDNVASEISVITAKAAPIGADYILIEDSAAANVKKSITIADLPTGSDADAIHDNVASEISAVAAKATPVGGDFILIEDSADTNAKKSITIADLDILRSQLTDLWYDGDHATGASPYIETGTFTFTYGGAAETFTNAFTSTPRIAGFGATVDVLPTISALSTSGFTGKSRDIDATGTPSTVVTWIAVGTRA